MIEQLKNGEKKEDKNMKDVKSTLGAQALALCILGKESTDGSGRTFPTVEESFEYLTSGSDFKGELFVAEEAPQEKSQSWGFI